MTQPQNSVTIRDAATREILGVAHYGSRSVVDFAAAEEVDFRELTRASWGGITQWALAHPEFAGRRVSIADEYRY